MKICEGCIKQDVCKFKKEIDHWDKEGFFHGNKTVPKPLKVDIYCELKVAEEKPGVNWGTDTTWDSGNATYTPESQIYVIDSEGLMASPDGVNWTPTRACILASN